ncbi:TIM-barrel domain-containing protein [Labilithrix luteola]
MVMGLSLGVSGSPFFGADTGGYQHSPPEAELFVRWAEQTALSSVMQVGDSSSQPPWVFTPDNGRDATSLDIYRTYARLHMRLFPYEWTYANRIAEDGRPIQRPLGLTNPELGVHPSDAYFFGEELLVLPVVTRGERVRRGIVPAGIWIDWWDGTPFTSDGRTEISIDAPLEKLPLLLREGAIVPMLRPTIDTISPADDPTVDSFARDAGGLWTRLVPGPSRSFALWDGTKIERLADGTLATTTGTVFQKGFVFEVVTTAEPGEVTRDSVALPKQPDLTSLEAVAEGWAWAPDRRGTLWIKIGAGNSQVRIH